ncbi:MAG TPA: ShlB/FhaC/HecB family hemolysin secretion/activation protein [Herbaspirillum sp.]|uniref:ShlB/FhaC/HecB family hemolysin secretion/activation protein n=1 Tax=Herbaspirillum sp. TaxID=1890675 RepID=UPI002D39C9B0|nr:ShlB/FhaC/HecB family hemolysin secretion/activation protein [Herbaspirillum sp.]HZG21534.1 ShlB/FhaC/HecB family hemolysin secretion/activation protein [Herbaspirillum sp.]
MKRRILNTTLCAALAAVLPHALTSAQTLGIQQEQLQRERERILRQYLEQAPDVLTLGLPASPAPALTYPEDERPCSRIEAISLEGEAARHFGFALATVNRRAADGGATGRCLGSQGVQTLIAHVQNAIIGRGFTTTRVLAPAQDLSAGRLILTVIPGRVRKVRMAEGADGRGTPLNALPLSEGDLLNLRAIEQGLENLKRVPTAEADIQITPSEDSDAQIGDSDLLVQYRQGFPLRLATSLDDGGARATGRYQAGATISYDNWWTLNDLFYVSLNRSLGRYGDRGSRGHTVHYSLPFGYWLLSATSSTSLYHQTVAGAFEPVIYSGHAENSELKLTRLLHRSASSKTSVAAKLLLRRSFNFIDGIALEPQQRRMSAWELGVQHRHFIATAVADVSLSHRRAVDRQGPQTDDPLALPQIVSRYGLWLADATLNLPWLAGPARLRYSGAVRAQWNRGPLPAQDQFAIGGRYTVRGFDGELTLQAERGWFVRNELALALGESGQEVYAGLDTGAVAGPTARQLIGRRLSGAALGMRGQWAGLGYELFVATPVVKPALFPTAPLTGGFSVQWSY